METINIYKKYIKKHKKDIRELEREIRVYLKKIDELLNKEELPKWLEDKVIYTDIYKENIYEKDGREKKIYTVVRVKKSNWEILKVWLYINVGCLEISPNWKSFAFKFEKDNWKDVIIKDGKELWKYEWVWDIKYSPNSESFAYKVRKNYEEYAIIKDWIELWECAFVFCDFKYSPNSKSFAYTIKKDDWNYAIIKDWKELWEYSIIWSFKYSEDSKNILLKVTENWETIKKTLWNTNLWKLHLK